MQRRKRATIRLSRFQKKQLPPETKQRLLKDCERLEKCFDFKNDDHMQCEAKADECLALRDLAPAQIAEAVHSRQSSLATRLFKEGSFYFIETWFVTCFWLDTRRDILVDAAAKCRQRAAELVKVADRIDAAVKRRPKAERSARRA